MSQEEIDYYRRQLDQKNRELSETIDEVVFVERARAEAEHRNVSSTIRIAALEEEVRILRQQLQTAHLSPQSRSNSQQNNGNNLGFNSPNNNYTGGSNLIEENASLRGEIAALQAQQLSHTDITLSNQRTTTARLEQLARQLHGSENDMDMLRRRLEQAESGERAYSGVVHERNLLEQRVGALEDLLKNQRGSGNNNNNPQQQQQQTPAQQLLAASQALSNSTNGANSNPATTAQLMELRNQIEQMARDANQRQMQVDAAVQRLAATEQRGYINNNNAAGDNNGLATTPVASSYNNNNNNNKLGSSVAASPSVSSNDRTRLLAFEKTVQSLNLELATMEQKLREVEGLYSDQQQRFALARKDFEADQRECDQVVAAMAAELEQLMDDNAKLRQRLRGKTQQAAENAAAFA